METSGRISQYRDRLDKTLASPDLTNEDTLKSLIKNQFLSTALNGDEECSEDLLERRTKDVSHFLEMLRSASITGDGNQASEKSHAEWKLKQDNEEFRVMYREGPPGTPLHTLLVEGYVDGPIDACLCISWESGLYKKWWPQYNVPTFKVVSSKSVHKIRIGEQLSLVRVKISWPLSAREALLQFFVFEYFQDDLIVVLLNSIDESEGIDRRTHGYSSDVIPEVKDVVRIGVVGGFALQKVTQGRSYFRTIANMDLKLDFVPPTLINFISRQLIGSGFRLYQKAVVSVYSSDGDFKKALLDPLYSRIREVLYSSNEQNGKLETKEIKSDASDALKMHTVEVNECGIEESTKATSTVEDGTKETIEEIHIDQTDRGACSDDTEETSVDTKNDENDREIFPNEELAETRSTFCEIEEEVSHDIRDDDTKSNAGGESSSSDKPKKVRISPEVEEALGTLEKVITIVREHGWNAHNKTSSFSDEESEDVESARITVSTQDGTAFSTKDQVSGVVLNKETTARSTEETRNSTSSQGLRSKKSSSLREVNHKKVAPASPLENLVAISAQNDLVTLYSSEKNDLAALYSSEKGTTDTPDSDREIKDTASAKDGTKGNSMDTNTKSRRRRRYRLWCFHPASFSGRRIG